MKQISGLSMRAEREILAYLEENRFEDVSAEETAMRLEVKVKTAARYLSRMVHKGELERISVYRLPIRDSAAQKPSEDAC